MTKLDTLSAGSAGVWLSEYGDPQDPIEGAFLRSISPLDNLRPGQEYPRPLIVTSTNDDTVHPLHARKMAARMAELGHPFYFFESPSGGHGSAMGDREVAELAALEFTYFTEALFPRQGSAEQRDIRAR